MTRQFGAAKTKSCKIATSAKMVKINPSEHLVELYG